MKASRLRKPLARLELAKILAPTQKIDVDNQTRLRYLDLNRFRLFGFSICWAVSETSTQFRFPLYLLFKKLVLIKRWWNYG